MPRLLASVALLALVAPIASAAVEEIALPADSRPLALAFAPDGKLWVTLDGPWAVGEFDTATSNLTLHPLATPPAPVEQETPGAPGDSLFALRRGPDGAWWTASQTNLHRVAPGSNATAWPLPEATALAGDVAFQDGKVLVALVTADAIGVLEPATGAWTTMATPPRFGPLHFAASADGLLVTGTYAGSIAVVDLAGRNVTPVAGGFAGPVGLHAEGNAVWVAEMGASSVGRSAGAVVHYPTTPSPFYPASGPSDVVVAGADAVWFVEHFADRVAKLDPVNGTLVEWMMPSAPGTNVQRLALGPDGRLWVAQWSTSKLAWVRDDGGHRFPAVTPERVRVEVGKEAALQVDVPVASFGSATPGLTARPAAGGATLVVGPTVAPGEHLVLVAAGSRPLLEGRYVRVEVVPPADAPPAETPAATALAALAALALAARWRR